MRLRPGARRHRGVLRRLRRSRWRTRPTRSSSIGKASSAACHRCTRRASCSRRPGSTSTGVVRTRLGDEARRRSPRAEVTAELTGMTIGGVTPFGPAGRPAAVDRQPRDGTASGSWSAAAAARAKVVGPPSMLLTIPAAEVVDRPRPAGGVTFPRTIRHARPRDGSFRRTVRGNRRQPAGAAGPRRSSKATARRPPKWGRSRQPGHRAARWRRRPGRSTPSARRYCSWATSEAHAGVADAGDVDGVGRPGTGRRGWRSTARRPTAPRPVRGRSSGWRRRRRRPRPPALRLGGRGCSTRLPGTVPHRSPRCWADHDVGPVAADRCGDVAAAARDPRRPRPSGWPRNSISATPTTAPLARSSVWRAAGASAGDIVSMPASPDVTSTYDTVAPGGRPRRDSAGRSPHSMSSGWATITVAF